MNADHVRDLSTPDRARRARLGRALAMAQAGNELAPKLPSSVRVDGGLVRDLHVGFVGPHVRQCPRDLRRRPTPAQASLDHAPQLQLWVQLGPRAGCAAVPRAGHLRIAHGIRLRRAVAQQFAAQRAGTAVQYSGDSAQAVHLLSLARQRHLLFGLQLSLFSFLRHVRTPPGGKVLHFRFETADQICLYISRET